MLPEKLDSFTIPPSRYFGTVIYFSWHCQEKRLKNFRLTSLLGKRFDFSRTRNMRVSVLVFTGQFTIRNLSNAHSILQYNCVTSTEFCVFINDNLSCIQVFGLKREIKSHYQYQKLKANNKDTYVLHKTLKVHIKSHNTGQAKHTDYKIKGTHILL